MILTPAQREQFVEQGYVIVERAVAPGMLEPLRAASRRVIERTRGGDWPFRRGDGQGDYWAANHLMHPTMGEPLFGDYLASDAVLEVGRELLGPSLRMSLLHLFFNPVHENYTQGWHRDLLHHQPTPEEEDTLLASRRDGIQWNTALYDDTCLQIVPGSHRRAATPAERKVQYGRPTDPIPGGIVVALKAGQGVYYTEQLLHRGVYRTDRRRETLHGSLHRHPSVESHPAYYHSVEWFETPGFRAALPERLQPLYDNWLLFADDVRAAEAAEQTVR